MSVEGYLGFGDLERLVHPRLSLVSSYQWAYAHHWKNSTINLLNECRKMKAPLSKSWKLFTR